MHKIRTPTRHLAQELFFHNPSVFKHRFLLTDADHYVLKYLESQADRIPSETLNSIRQTLGVSASGSGAQEQGHTQAGEEFAQPAGTQYLQIIYQCLCIHCTEKAYVWLEMLFSFFRMCVCVCF